MTTHKLKSWTHFFQAIKAGEKLHDIRSKKDRDFLVGDRVVLQEYDPFGGKYTGQELEAEITYITSDVTPCAFSSAVLDKDYCVLSLRLVPTAVLEVDGYLSKPAFDALKGVEMKALDPRIRYKAKGPMDFCPECGKPHGECDPEGVGHYRG